MQKKKKDQTPDTIEDEPESVQLKSALAEKDIVTILFQCGELYKSIVNIVAISTQTAGLKNERATALYCASALIRAADTFFILGKFAIEDELDIIHDLIIVSEKLAKSGYGIPASEASKLSDWTDGDPVAAKQDSLITDEKKSLITTSNVPMNIDKKNLN